MDSSPLAHMFERLENCHKLSQLAPNSRSNTLAAGLKAFAGDAIDPGQGAGSRGARLGGATGRSDRIDCRPDDLSVLMACRTRT